MYSKVACLLSLEATNEVLPPPVFVTDFSRNTFPSTDLSQGEVGSWEVGDGNKRESELAVRDGTTIAPQHNQPAGAASLPAPSPAVRGDIECQ